jgi:hypothetical protein
VRRLERIRGESYPDIAQKVGALMRCPPLAGGCVLVVDQTGCARPVFDMFEKARLDPIGVYIHRGDAVTHDGNIWRVPKRGRGLSSGFAEQTAEGGIETQIGAGFTK